jgi:hypothetical protein
VQGCSCARLIALAASPAEAQELEDESCSLFFRAAAAFSQPAAFPGQAAALARCAAQLLADAAMGGSQLGDGPEVGVSGSNAVARWRRGGTPLLRFVLFVSACQQPVCLLTPAWHVSAAAGWQPGPRYLFSGCSFRVFLCCSSGSHFSVSPSTEPRSPVPGLSPRMQAAELAYYEALATLFERMGRYGAAARCALAAARQAAAALPAPAQLPARAAAQARLWANVFACSLDAGRPEVGVWFTILVPFLPPPALLLLRALLGSPPLCAAASSSSPLPRMFPPSLRPQTRLPPFDILHFPPTPPAATL